MYMINTYRDIITTNTNHCIGYVGKCCAGLCFFHPLQCMNGNTTLRKILFTSIWLSSALFIWKYIEKSARNMAGKLFVVTQALPYNLIIFFLLKRYNCINLFI